MLTQRKKFEEVKKQNTITQEQMDMRLYHIQQQMRLEMSRMMEQFMHTNIQVNTTNLTTNNHSNSLTAMTKRTNDEPDNDQTDITRKRNDLTLENHQLSNNSPTEKAPDSAFSQRQSSNPYHLQWMQRTSATHQ
jgi:hypothetical protein